MEQPGRGSQRTWSDREEEVLIQCLKDLVVGGWKADNGFRAGYQRELEKGMKKVFPMTDIRATPHINSKVHVWKKIHGSLVSMLAKSGIGWNSTTKMIHVEDEEAWTAYCKLDTNARLMRYKGWPYFDDWREIFGKDRATGTKAEDVMDAVNEMIQRDNGLENMVEHVAVVVEDERREIPKSELNC